MALKAGYQKLKQTNGRPTQLFGDGNNLYLQVSTSDKGKIRRSWVFRYAVRGKQKSRYMGLGGIVDVTLEEARDLARDCRKLLKGGLDPISERDRLRAKNIAQQAELVTFDEAAKRYIAGKESGWRNPKHAAQWASTLKTYASPVIGRMSVADIQIAHVMKVLEPIWKAKTETASRLRGRIESVLDWATTSGYRKGENPARWQGCLENLLPAPNKVRKVEHHPAMPYADVPAFVAELREREGVAALALEFAILTAARSGEVRNMVWSELDLRDNVWTVPGSKMKGGREHRVPLSARALAILELSKAVADGEPVFPGINGKPLSDMSLIAVLHRMGKTELTVHGFRSSFRDWAGDETEFFREVSEAAISHIVGDKAEQAYRRGDALEKRRKLMDAWARYCEGKPVEKVVKLRG